MRQIKLLMGFAMLLLGTQAQALLITPSTTSLVPGVACTSVTPDGATACASNDANTIDEFIVDMYGVTALYKSDVPGEKDASYPSENGIDGGAFAGSYDTVFANTITDPSTASITFNIGSDSIDCPDCYLLVKDGNQNPAWYLFDIGTWNGEATIDLSGFWPYQGAISHVAIYGGEQTVPEPGILALLGLGLVGMVASRRKVK